MKDQLFVQATIKDGKLHFPIKAYETKYNKFISSQPDGIRVELFIGVQDGKGSNPQLARIHAMIREIANEVGHTFEEMKLQVKRKAGLCFNKNDVEFCKSFGKCDKEELNLAIQACLEIGDFAGMQLR
tara:strand:- start:1515 stop:1898 length:384 start_codon:yes stop_codon:yes gene_type:complete